MPITPLGKAEEPEERPEEVRTSARAKTGFSSQPDEYSEPQLNLHEHMVPHPMATDFYLADGRTEEVLIIHQDDLLIIDRSLPLRDGDLVLASDGLDWIVRRTLCHSCLYVVGE